jgi:hypothetical protein
MRPSNSGVIASALLLMCALPSLASSPRVHRGPTAPHHAKTSTTPGKTKTAAVRGIEPERATQIQTALIKNGYMTGSPSGVWDANSEAAMQKLQADNGWQTKLVPDSRAIIKLGLGPTGNSTVAAAPAEAAETKADSPIPNR